MKHYLRIFQTGMASLAIVCLVTSASWGEEKGEKQPAKRPAFKQLRLPARMIAGFGGRSTITLVSQQQIQTEIKITDAQKNDIKEMAKEYNTKSRDLYKGLGAIKNKEERQKVFKEINKKRQALTKETDKKVNKILDDAQKKRIQQILLQQVGIRAITQKRVIKELEITEDQQNKIKGVFESQKEKGQAIFKDMKDGKIKQGEIGKKFKELRDSIDTDANNVLTEAQQKKLKEMKGEKFEWKRMPRVRLNQPRVKIRKTKIGKAIPAQALPIKIRIQAQPKKIEK